MDLEKQMQPEMETAAPVVHAIGPEQLKKFIEVLQKYRTGKKKTDDRISSHRRSNPCKGQSPCRCQCRQAHNPCRSHHSRQRTR